jgi:hypothetical protein
MRDDDERRAILERRKRFLVMALTSAGLVAGTADCGGDTTTDRNKADASAGGSGGSGGIAQPCLGAPAGGGTAGTPEPCLSAPAGGYAGEPQVCLSGAPGSGGWPEPDAAGDPDASEDA